MLNKAMLANPVFQIVAGLALLAGAIYTAYKIYDHFTMSVKEANEALDKFHEKQK